MSKGKRRERQAAALYERAGYQTYRPQHSKWGETDMFNLFDILAVPGRDENLEAALPEYRDYPRLVQVKSNRAEGIVQWCRDVVATFSGPIYADFLVCHDNEGWRLLTMDNPSGFRETRNLDVVGYQTVVDERDEDGAMGDLVVEYLGGSVDDE